MRSVDRRLMQTVALILFCATPAVAQDISLTQPLDCTLGDTCYIQQYADRDPGPDATDFACGPLSYDTHSGTDFALPTLAAQALGVNVLAAAAGEVIGIRDEMPDILQGTPGAPDVTDRECGNGVVMRHPDGWETQYCHMALGSIIVKPGDQLQQGAVLGQVGLSGQSQFPHVHLSVRQNGSEIDPFDPDQELTCGQTAPGLWSDPIPYVPGGLIAAGFSSAVPQYDAIKAGTAAETLTTTSPGLVLWGFAFGGQAGDVTRISITGPNGEAITQDDTLDRAQAQFFRASGKRIPTGGWPPGDYAGTIDLIRDHVVIDSITIAITL
jgi:Peptidase family M23